MRNAFHHGIHIRPVFAGQRVFVSGQTRLQFLSDGRLPQCIMRMGAAQFGEKNLQPGEIAHGLVESLELSVERMMSAMAVEQFRLSALSQKLHFQSRHSDTRIDLVRPSSDAAFDIPHIGEAMGREQIASLGAATPKLAMDDDALVARHFGEALW